MAATTFSLPITTTYRPAPCLPTLGAAFFDVVTPAVFPSLTLRHRNQKWAAQIGLGALTDVEWQDAFGRFAPLPDNLTAPLALRYHGHQFRTYNAQLGDGRGFLYAQLRDGRGRLLDLATKGSGQTPWSRGGDGRLTLKGGVREVLATELLEALGVPTSKSFSLFETGEWLERHDEPSPTRASVLVRLGHSHIRIGSFQRHAYLGDRASLRALVDFSLAQYAPEICHRDELLAESAAALLLSHVATQSAYLCAAWMAAGFVHGVLNTDNLNVTGESFDYGPYRFLPTLDVGFTAAYFDHTGLYAYGRQPEAVRWKLVQLAHALQPLGLDGDSVGRALRLYDDTYETALDLAFVRRLGVVSRGGLRDRILRGAIWELLAGSQIGFERFFFDWYGGRAALERRRPQRSPVAAAYNDPRAAPALDELAVYAPQNPAALDHPYFAGESPCTLLIDEVERIWSAIAERDDWSLLAAKLQSISLMSSALNFAVL